MAHQGGNVYKIQECLESTKNETFPRRGYIIMVQQYMASLRGIIISNNVISKAPSVAVIYIITSSGTCRRTSSIR